MQRLQHHHLPQIASKTVNQSSSPYSQVDPVAQLLQANRSDNTGAAGAVAANAEVEKLKEKLKVLFLVILNSTSTYHCFLVFELDRTLKEAEQDGDRKLRVMRQVNSWR